MHVRIAWEIYHHQQKQAETTRKGGLVPAAGLDVASSSKSVPPSDILRPLNNLFSLPSRHEMPSFSSTLLSAAVAHSAARSPFAASLPTPLGSPDVGPHLGVPPYSRPGYSSFGGFGPLNTLGMFHVPTTQNSPSLFGVPAVGGRDLPIAGCLPGLSASVPDPWGRGHRAAGLFPPLTSAANSSPWGGLKAEADREKPDFDKRRLPDGVKSGDARTKNGEN